MNIISFTDIKNWHLIKNTDENDRDIKLYLFENIILSGFSEYYPDILFKSDNDDFLILPIKEMSMSLNKKSYYEENNMIFNYKNNNDNIINIEYDTYFFIYNTENYYHFIYDTLPYLYCYLELKKSNKNLKLLMNFNKNNNSMLPYVKESLELLNIKNDDIIIHNKNNFYKKVYLSSSLTHNGLSNKPPRNEIFDIYNIITENALKHIDIYKHIIVDNVYISRRTWINNIKNDNIGTNYTTRRKLMNEDELVEKLNDYNFKEFFGENLTMIEKIILFNNAKCVIGAIGSTITNCIFCNSQCKIITLVSPHFLNINYRMKYLFNNINVIYFYNTSVHNINNEISNNVRIEITDNTSIHKSKIGEIEKKINDKYLIKLSNNLIGFNISDTFVKIQLSENQFKILDNGLNSNWILNINKLIKIIKYK